MYVYICSYLPLLESTCIVENQCLTFPVSVWESCSVGKYTCNKPIDNHKRFAIILGDRQGA